MISIIALKTWEHLQLTFIAIMLSLMIALPLGVFLAKSRQKKLVSFLMKVIMVMQTIPGLALVALVMVFLIFIRPVLALPTIGVFPGTIVLVAYGLLPIVSNTYAGIKQVNQSTVEVATAIGMTPLQVLFWIQLPLAFPVVLMGIRVALVSTIGLVTLTSLIGTGGLGDLILQGLRTMKIDLIVAGTLPAALLVVVFDTFLNWAAKKISPIHNLS